MISEMCLCTFISTYLLHFRCVYFRLSVDTNVEYASAIEIRFGGDEVIKRICHTAILDIYIIYA